MKFTDEELAFIEQTLKAKENVELVVEDGEDNSVNIQEITAPKRKKKKVPPYKNPAHWVAGFVIAPVLLSAVLMFLIFRVESMFGNGTLKWLSEDPTGQEVQSLASQMGFEWLQPVVSLYENRWLIVALLFTVFFLVAVFVILWDNFFSVKINGYFEKKRKIKQEAKGGATDEQKE